MDNNINIFRLERLKKRTSEDKWTDSQSVKLTITDKEMPSHIIINYIRYKIRPYIQEPMQCYKCQRLGHTSKSCRAPQPRCMRCGKSHQKSECQTEQLFCINCKGNHSSNSKLCPIIKHAQRIEKVKALQQVDHTTARKIIRQQDNIDTEYIQDEIPQMQSTQSSHGTQPSYSYANVTKGLINKPISDHSQQYAVSSRYKMMDVSTQTTEKETKSDKSTDEKFLTNLRNFIIDILNINFTKESKQAKLSLADNAIKNNFGIDLRHSGNTESDIESEVEMEANQTKQGKLRDRKRKRDKSSENKNDFSEIEDTSSQDENVISDENSLWVTVEKKKVKKKNNNKRGTGKSNKNNGTKIRRKNE